LQRNLADAEPSPQPRRQTNQFGVNVRASHAVGFNADLVKLAVAALLRFFVAKHRPGVPQPLGLVMQQAMLDAGADATCSALRAQGQTLIVAVGEGVHLFLNDVGHFANRAGKQLGLFNYRQTDFAVIIGGERLAHRGFEALPQRRFAGQDVIHATDGLKRLGHGQGEGVNVKRLTVPRRGR